MIWKDRPGVVFNWLHAAGAPWGTAPVLDSTGAQCTTPAEVDAAVRGYWVDEVLRKHAHVDEDAAWAALLRSRFGPHLPVAQWDHQPWDGSRVRAVLQRMKEAAAPGSRGIPIAVWRALPDSWMAAVARLLTMVEEAGRWPEEWLEAYVAMIPKAAGGTRPRDQRPITVLDLLYRIWSKGVVMEWTAVLQRTVLGQAAMGFRSGTSTLHVAQLLADLIALRKRLGRPLWLAGFDVEKCFDSLPWWGLFRVLRHAGVDARVVRGFAAFYRHLRRRFRYGQVDGALWQSANGLAQGCPASPDLLNLLLEAFHQWAVAEGLGVSVGDCRIPSVSFADDLTLVAGSLEEISDLILAYLEFCELLGLNVTKVQLWTNTGAGQVVHIAGKELVTSETYRVVGIELGASEALATQVHVAPRVRKALATTRRLQHLDLPVLQALSDG